MGALCVDIYNAHGASAPSRRSGDVSPASYLAGIAESGYTDDVMSMEPCEFGSTFGLTFLVARTG